MPELIDVLEECIEIVESEEYLIDKVVMSEKRVNMYTNELRNIINIFLEDIKRKFPDIDKFKYRRLIFPYEITPDEEGMIIYNGEPWEVMKSSEYDSGSYNVSLNEVFLKREK